MFSIKWCNDHTNFRTTYFGAFKRLASCNAAYYLKEEQNESKNMSYATYGLVSYATPICKVVYWHNLETNADGYHVYVNRDAYRCSSSTIHQLGRFLRITVGDLFTYHDIKWYDEHTGDTHVYIKSYLPITLWWVDGATMRDSMATFDSAWYVNERA